MLIRSPTELAQLVADHRRRQGLSQVEVAERVGLKQKTISAFENKPEGTKLATVFLILSALNLNLQCLEKDKAINTDEQWKQEW